MRSNLSWAAQRLCSAQLQAPHCAAQQCRPPRPPRARRSSNAQSVLSISTANQTPTYPPDYNILTLNMLNDTKGIKYLRPNKLWTRKWNDFSIGKLAFWLTENAHLWFSNRPHVYNQWTNLVRPPATYSHDVALTLHGTHTYNHPAPIVEMQQLPAFPVSSAATLYFTLFFFFLFCL